jgi:hypothetical protein
LVDEIHEASGENDLVVIVQQNTDKKPTAVVSRKISE